MKTLLIALVLSGLGSHKRVEITDDRGRYLAIYAVDPDGKCVGAVPVANPVYADSRGNISVCVSHSKSYHIRVLD